MGWHGFPVLDGDAMSFMPNAVSVARGDGLVNVFWSTATELDPAGEGRLIWHGFLDPLVLGHLASASNSLGVLWARGVTDAAAIALTSAWMMLIAPWNSSPRWVAVNLVLAIFATTAATISVAGRPEGLCVTMIAGALVASTRLPASLHPSLGGLLVGLLAATSPAVAVASLGVAGLILVREGHSLADLLPLILLPLPVLALTLILFYPWPFDLWLGGLATHARALLPGDAAWAPSLGRYYLWNPATPALGVLAATVVALIARKKEILGRPLVSSLAVAPLLVTVLVVLRRPELVYYVAAFIPAICGGVVALGSSTRPMLALSTIVLAPVSLGAGLVALQYGDYLDDGVALRSARARYAALASDGRPIFATPALWALGEGTNLALADSRSCPEAPAVLLVQQVSSGLLTPQPIDGCVLLEHDFVNTPPTFLGLPYGRAVKGYSFAVFEARPVQSSPSTLSFE